jgi:uncharacterized protein
MKKRKLSCVGCKAKCCRYVTVRIPKPKNKDDYEEILWYFMHKNIEVFVENGKWNILFNTKCKGLNKNWKCSVYNKRPKVCIDHNIKDCEKFGKNNPKDYYFKNYKQFLNYLRSKGIEFREIE